MKRNKYHNCTNKSLLAIKGMRHKKFYRPNKNGFLAPLIMLFGVLVLLILAIVLVISLLISL